MLSLGAGEISGPLVPLLAENFSGGLSWAAACWKFASFSAADPAGTVSGSRLGGGGGGAARGAGVGSASVPHPGGRAQVRDDVGDAVGEAARRVVLGQRVVGGDLVQDRSDVGAGSGGALELRSECGPVRVGGDPLVDGVA